MKRSDFKPLNLLIGIPSRGEFKVDMAMNLAFLIHVITANPLLMWKGETRFINWKVHCPQTSLLPQSRQLLVDLALDPELAMDYLLMIDDDMVFEPTFILDWLKEDRPVLAMNCPTRSIPCHATAREFDPNEPYKGKVVYSDVATMRFQRVWRVGTGIMLLRADAMRSLPRPAFTPRWESGNDHYVGEDWAMCEHLEAAGIPILIDNEASLSIKHIGNMAFTHEMTAATRRVVEKQKGPDLVLPPGLVVPN